TGGVDIDEVIADWTRLLDSEFGILHRWDLRAGATLYRRFLLPTGLEIDLSFSPEDHFAARGPAFVLLSGKAAEASEASPPDVDELVGLGWLFLWHALAALERQKYWSAEYFISATRDQVLTLACLRVGEETAYARGFDRLPKEITTPMQGALAASLDPTELHRALSIAAEGLMQEISFVNPRLSRALRGLVDPMLHG
ncbi:MAG: hypothetical protein M3P18_26065, partial [Actinomycetota bacterium]|nr:hypothetical protein [Actinomycetota bacterium]